MINNYMNPDPTMRAAGLMAAVASAMLNRTNTLVIWYGWGNDVDPVGKESYANDQSEHLHEDESIYGKYIK